MCTLVVISLGVIGGLVSNNSDSEMRELNAQGAEFDLLAWAFSWSEPHVDKRKGQRSNRKLNGPSGSFSTGRDCRKEIFWCLAGSNRYMNFYGGNVLGDPVQTDVTSCRDGNEEARSSLGQGTSKSKSLFHTCPIHIASGEGNYSGVEDNFLLGVLRRLKARETIVFDHNDGFAGSLMQGLLACGHGVHPVKEAASLLLSQSLLCTQERGTESMEGTSGRADDPSDGEKSLSHSIGETVSGSRSVHSMFTNNDNVYNLPTLILELRLSSHALRQAFPVWTSMETSHPFIQLSSCLATFTEE